MKKKDPAFLFYSKDWLEGTAEYSPSEKGVYIDLLAYQHQRGNLPTDLDRLSRLVRLNTKDFIKIWDVISEKFEKKEEKYINSKLQEVMQERSEKGHKNKIIGTFGYVLKKLNLNTKTEKELRKVFNVNDFLNYTEWNSERCTEWCLNAIAVIEDANEDINKIEYKIEKPKDKIPTQKEFLTEAKEKIKETSLNYYALEFSLKAKYDAWVGNGWKDGNNKKILNWKTKLANTLPYLREIKDTQKEKQNFVL